MHRPASYPYLSGDGFRAGANFVYDQFLAFDPRDVSFGDIVFVRTNYLKDFFNKIHPDIKEKYVLLSNNEDGTVGKEFADFVDDKIIHWYSQNLNFIHPQASLLPIGMQNFVVGRDDNFIQSFSGSMNFNDKKDRILFGFTLNDSVPERNEAHAALSRSKIADHISLPRTEYYMALSTYKFIASPRGAGLDCHRTWEALHYKVIPVILRSDFSEQIAKLGFPILLLDAWSEVENLSGDFLSDYYEKNRGLFETPKLYLAYWYDMFAQHRIK